MYMQPTNKPCIEMPTPVNNTAVMPNNDNQFDFPLLSSDEDNSANPPVPLLWENEPTETHLTEEEDDAVSALLSLSKSLPSENSQEDLNNSELLLIGKPTVDAALVPIRLGLEDVNEEIARIRLSAPNLQTNPPSTSVMTTTTTTTTTIIMNQDGAVLSTRMDETSKSPVTSPNAKGIPSDDSQGSPQGDFKLRSYKFKKKVVKSHNFSCKSCGVINKSVQDLNKHHKQTHKQVMCGTCNKLFDAPLQLARHMYEHYEKTLQCDRCDQGFTFQSELDKHKVNHRENPSHRCMKLNCDKWFFHIQDLKFHLLTHENTELKCVTVVVFAIQAEAHMNEF